LKGVFSLLLVLMLCGCANQPPVKTPLPRAFVASFYPVYALAVNVVHDAPDRTLTCLTQPRDDCLRSYILSDWDIALIARTDVLLIGGRGLESFEGALQSMTESVPDAPAVISLMANLTLINQGIVSADEDASHFQGENPWLFLSTKGAEEICAAIALSLSSLDPENAGLYEENRSDFAARMAILRAEMEEIIAPVRDQPVALMHEGLRYFAEEWALNPVAVVEREPGMYFEDVELDDVLQTLADSGARAVLLEMQAPMRLRRDLERAGYAVVRIDTLTTGITTGNLYAYEEAMRHNARALAMALQETRR